MNNKILVILGPTSTGKTDLALDLAKKFNGELVACDSRQVYIGLDIGTGKLPGKEVTVKMSKGFWEMDGVKIWMYDVADPKKQYTVFNYAKDVEEVVENILNRGKLPIIVGGTGLYLKALLEGLSNLAVPIDLKLRKKLETASLMDLQIRFQQLAPRRWEKMNNSDRQNPRRLIRGIEITSTAFTSEEPLRATFRDGFKPLKIGLNAQRDILYQRINERVIDRIDQGMVDEAVVLLQRGLSLQRMRQLGLEYGVLADYLEGKIKSKEDLVKVLQGKIHGYARRQMTWFKREKDVFWFDISHKNYANKVENLVVKWYDIYKYASKS